MAVLLTGDWTVLLTELEIYMQMFLSELLLGLFFRIICQASRCFQWIQRATQEGAVMVYFILSWFAAKTGSFSSPKNVYSKLDPAKSRDDQEN